MTLDFLFINRYNVRDDDFVHRFLRYLFHLKSSCFWVCFCFNKINYTDPREDFPFSNVRKISYVIGYQYVFENLGKEKEAA